jgi:hypothetical protein
VTCVTNKSLNFSCCLRSKQKLIVFRLLKVCFLCQLNFNRLNRHQGGKMPKTTVKPGARVPDSGIYETESGDRATMVSGETAPPTANAGETWTQVVDTNPKNNKK